MADAQLLAELAGDAYSQNPAKSLPDGFSAVDLPGLQMHNGLYSDGSAQAVVSTGSLDGSPVVVLAFRGSNDRQDWIDDLRNIDAQYADFQPLIAAVKSYAGDTHVVVVGHSLGGAMAQLFMEQNPGDQFRAVTFGSPGALLPAPADDDPRITNYAVSDDPIVFLGENRAEVAAYALAHPMFAAALVADLSAATPLTPKEIIASVPYMTNDYANEGVTHVLPGASPGLDLADLPSANPAEHDIGLYVSLTGAISSLWEPSLWV
jgi:pimeloyl-ACP methyl ester carboxylesterase